MATNQHLAFALINVALNMAMVLAAYLLSGEIGVLGLAAIYLAGEITTFITALSSANHVHQKTNLQQA